MLASEADKTRTLLCNQPQGRFTPSHWVVFQLHSRNPRECLRAARGQGEVQWVGLRPGSTPASALLLLLPSKLSLQMEKFC